MDIDPFCAIGITAATMRFLDVFLLYCLLHDSPADTPEEIATLSRNQHRVALRGREPGMRLERADAEIGLADWGRDVLDECAPIAAALDGVHGGAAHADVLADARTALDDPAKTPSARVLREMEREFGNSFLEFALARSRDHKARLLELPLPAEVEQRHARMAEESLVAQRQIEAADRVPFETYRQNYLAQDLMSGVQLQSRG
jgi:glutamate--cysteine ligase